MTAKPVIIFGDSSFASLAWYCLTHDSPREVIGFAVDGAWQRQERHHGLPVLPFEGLTTTHPPERVELLIPLGYHRINGLRRERFHQARAWGYDFVTYVSSRASTWPDLTVGANCLVFEQAIIQPFATLGDNVIIRSGVHVSHHVTVGDHCFVSAEAALAGNVTLGEQCFIGVNATVRDGLALAARTFVGAGAVVVRPTEADGVYVGNPARKLDKSAQAVTTS